MSNDVRNTPRDAPVLCTALSTSNTVVPRYIAALMDNLLAMLIAVLAAKFVGFGMPILQGAIAVVVYLGYYFIPELLFSRTFGKFVTGLVVVGVEGERCCGRQIAMRTAFRLLEVNPLFFGAIPAALSILFSRYHQRFGDKFAETLVVESRERRRHQLIAAA
jgi:uncharacterized RDD family membrane protein YckC